MDQARRERFIGMICLFAAVILWSTVEVVVRPLSEKISPLQFAAVRFTMATAILTPFAIAKIRSTKIAITPVFLGHSAWIAWIGVVGATLSYHYSLKYAGASVVATVYGTMPIVTLVLACLLLRESLTLIKSAGVALGFLGIFVLSSSGASATFTIRGFVFACMCIFFFSLFTVLVKKFAADYPTILTTTAAIVFGAVYLIILAAIEHDAESYANLFHYPLTLLYLGVCTTGITYCLYFGALERVEATEAAGVLLLKPPIALVLAATILGEPLTGNLLTALALVLAGLYLVSLRPRGRLVPEPE